MCFFLIFKVKLFYIFSVEVCADGSLEEVESNLLEIVTKELAKERGGVSKLWQVLEHIVFW